MTKNQSGKRRTTCGTVAKGAKKPVTHKKKSAPVAKRGAGKTANTGRKSLVKKSAAGLFEGATEISVTENKIAVTRNTSKSANGKYSERTTREYHDRTSATMKAFNDVLNNRAVKKVTVKLK